MAFNSGIEWTRHTDNLWWGCSPVHSEKGGSTPRMAIKSVWGDLLSQQAKAHEAGEVHRVFVGSMMDIFENPMPLIDHKGNALEGTTDTLRQRFFNEFVPNCPNLDFLLLTKRPSNINKYIPESWKDSPPANVMFGTSVSRQGHFLDIAGKLKQVNGRRFLSIEPQLDCIAPLPGDLDGIDWVIQGGESGSGKRPFNLMWADVMQKACAKAGVAYFFKQVDKVQPIPDWALVRQFPRQPLAA